MTNQFVEIASKLNNDAGSSTGVGLVAIGAGLAMIGALGVGDSQTLNG